MSITKLELADQIVSARHGFEGIKGLSTEELLSRCHEILRLKHDYSKQELFELRDRLYHCYD